MLSPPPRSVQNSVRGQHGRSLFSGLARYPYIYCTVSHRGREALIDPLGFDTLGTGIIPQGNPTRVERCRMTEKVFSSSPKTFDKEGVEL